MVVECGLTVPRKEFGNLRRAHLIPLRAGSRGSGDKIIIIKENMSHK